MSRHQKPCLRPAPLALDPSPCAQEPIHIPGAIQPHGALLAARIDDGIVTHASANLAAILGRPAEAVLGWPLGMAIGEVACHALRDAGLREGIGQGQTDIQVGPDGRNLHLRAYHSGRHLCVDIVPAYLASGQRTPITLMQGVLETFRQASNATELCEHAVRGLKDITGYDRVMAYRFNEGGHGEVIAEARTAQLEPFLGLRYPAADVPPQARQQYLHQRVGTIADSSYLPVPLLADPAQDDGTPLDLTHSALRSVSPYHREYMRNMKTAASLTIGLAHGPDLWGMLVCHHTTPRVAGPEILAIAGMVGQVVSLLLRSLGEAELAALQLERHASLHSLVKRLAAPVPLSDALAAAEAELLRLMGADGVAFRIAGTLRCLGRTPSRTTIEPALALLQAEAHGEVLMIDDLGLRYPELAACTREGSGMLLLPLAPGTDDAILWFRPEVVQTVTWGGNPAEHVTTDAATGRFSPRASFAAWCETVHGRSTPWSALELALAGELRSAVALEQAQRTKAELARLRHYDALTGLPNRSLLQEQLVAAEREVGVGTALLFLDLDRFKGVNDTMGHAAGDALLTEVARRLLVTAGTRNMAARLGGDEFVVLCRGQGRGAVTALAEEICQALAAPFEIAGRSCHISASIGIAFDDQSGELDLVRAADIAMYASKQRGGNRGVVFERSLFDQAIQQFDLERDLRAALGGGDQFTLLYQPLFGIARGTLRLVGFEALVRWRHPRHGWMSPALFIPLAEKSGLILPLGDWVLATALRQGRIFQQASPNVKMKMAVNVSALQLPQISFCSSLAGALEAEGFSPEALCLEITETLLTDAAAAAVLTDVRKLGVRVAIDDFGIGHSSLSYLRRLPADVVKLDRSFLEDVEGDPRDTQFVGAVVALVHAAGKPVVFEGIETQAQFEIASAAGADVVQGFFFAPPLSANAAEELVAQHARLEAPWLPAVPLLGLPRPRPEPR